MTDGKDGTACAPFAFIRLQDACLPSPEFAMVNGATAPDITLVTGVADTHDRRSHLKFTEVDKLTIFLHTYCTSLLLRRRALPLSSFLASRISFGP